MKLTDLNNPKYIAFETYKKNGDAVNTPLWVVEEAEKLYAWTDGNSWKVKRLRNNENVRLAESNASGKPKGEWMEAKGRVIEDSAEEEKMRKRLAQKYGFSYYLINGMQSIGRLFKKGASNHTAVVIEIRDA